MSYTLEEMSPEEGDALTKELQEVLAKYDAEMGVTSNINLMKRVHIQEEVKQEEILSPYNEHGDPNANKSEEAPKTD